MTRIVTKSSTQNQGGDLQVRIEVKEAQHKLKPAHSSGGFELANDNVVMGNAYHFMCNDRVGGPFNSTPELFQDRRSAAGNFPFTVDNQNAPSSENRVTSVR